jgi:hypothetical protein
MFTHETEKSLMIGTGIAIEYTRDSPLFRQQLSAIEESYAGISAYVDGFVHLLILKFSVSPTYTLFIFPYLYLEYHRRFLIL